MAYKYGEAMKREYPIEGYKGHRPKGRRRLETVTRVINGNSKPGAKNARTIQPKI